MDNSSQTANRKDNQFDVLVSQKEPAKKPLRFEDIPKPTELNPLPLVQKIEKKEIPVEEKIEKFVVPKPLTEYIHNLIKSGRKLKVLEFDISEAISADQIKSILSAKLDTGLINESEKREMLELLMDSSLETKMENKKNETVTLAVEELDEHTVRLRRKKLQSLRSNHGIVLENVGDTHTLLEQGIIDKSTKLWKGTTREEGLSIMFLNGGSLEFHVEPEPVVVTPASIVRSFDGVFRKKTKEPDLPAQAGKVVEKVVEKVVTPPVVVEKKEEKPEEKPLEKIVEKPKEKPQLMNTLTSDFQGKTVQVVRTGETITVTFDGKEIAKGTMTDIKINKEFKAGFFFAKTAEEQAFEKALPLIKTFKN